VNAQLGDGIEWHKDSRFLYLKPIDSFEFRAALLSLIQPRSHSGDGSAIKLTFLILKTASLPPFVKSPLNEDHTKIKFSHKTL
jgi:hypothetical protein